MVTVWVNQWNAFMHIGNEQAKRTGRNDSAVTYRTPQEPKG